MGHVGASWGNVAMMAAKLYQFTGRTADAHAVLGAALEDFAPTPEPFGWFLACLAAGRLSGCSTNGHYWRSSSGAPITAFLRRPACPATAGKRKTRLRHAFLNAPVDRREGRGSADEPLALIGASRERKGVFLSRRSLNCRCRHRDRSPIRRGRFRAPQDSRARPSARRRQGRCNGCRRCA